MNMNFYSRTLKSSQIFVLLTSLLLLAVMSSAALAFDASKDLTNQQTYDYLQQEKLILVDIRTTPEMVSSGIAKGALTIDMTDPKFLDEVAKLRLDNPDKMLAFICASGRRSTIVQTYLVENGYTNVFSVFGGTTGNGVAGWIKDGFPIVKYTQ